LSSSPVKGRIRGGVLISKFGRPWVIIHQEQFSTYTEARKKELFFKSGQGRKLIKEGGQDGNALVLSTRGGSASGGKTRGTI